MNRTLPKQSTDLPKRGDAVHSTFVFHRDCLQGFKYPDVRSTKIVEPGDMTQIRHIQNYFKQHPTLKSVFIDKLLVHKKTEGTIMRK